MLEDTDVASGLVPALLDLCPHWMLTRVPSSKGNVASHSIRAVSCVLLKEEA